MKAPTSLTKTIEFERRKKERERERERVSREERERKEQYFMGYISLDIHLLTCELILMLIGLVILHIDTPLLVTTSSLVTR